MKKLSFLLFSLFSLLLSAGVVADDKVSKDLALEYLELSKIEQVINTSISHMESRMFPDGNKKFHAMMEQAIGWDATKDQLVNLVVSIYTKEEIESSIAYMKSPIGASATEKSEEFSQQFSLLISKNMQEFIKSCCDQGQ